MGVKHRRCWLNLKKTMQAFETKCLRKLLDIYHKHKTKDYVRKKTKDIVGHQ